MAIRVALHHRSHYRFDRPVGLSPHEVRLRPAAHCRTPIQAYSLRVRPERHFINWQQDAYGNFFARLVFPEKTQELAIEVDLVAELTAINPFDFFVESYAEYYPFRYPKALAGELAPFLDTEAPGPRLARWLAALRADRLEDGGTCVDFLVGVNRRLRRDIRYLVRLEAGVQTAEETLAAASGSCRDSAWLLVQILRQLGLAARFASGYLIQLAADQTPLDGPPGPSTDFIDLHAWAEVYVPGAGWIGLDPTAGALAGDGYLPLACTATPASAAAVIGYTDPCEASFDFAMTVARLREDPRVTKPYSAAQWQEIDALGQRIDAELAAGDVRLTHGGEPTFVAADDMDGREWNFDALGPSKRRFATELLARLAGRFAPGGLRHYGQGKWYPGEPLPRWALGVYWRADGAPVWRDAGLLAAAEASGSAGSEEARRFMADLVKRLSIAPARVLAAFEDPWPTLGEEARLPVNVDPFDPEFADAAARARLVRLLGQGLDAVAGYVLPLRAAAVPPAPGQPRGFRSCAWPLRRQRLYLIPGDSPLGLRLPLDELPWVAPAAREPEPERDPFEARGALWDFHAQRPRPEPETTAAVFHTALCLEARGGRLHVFMPPQSQLEDYLALLAAVEQTAARLKQAVVIEGYPPPVDPRLRALLVTPDPGVIEVNIQPAASWTELVANTEALYEEARLTRLAGEKFMLDGRHTGTGGGNHVTLGGPTAADSPWLRRPDLLASLITYWQRHPALSYLFSGAFVGPTSQAPRVDEARNDNLYELEIAFDELRQWLPAGAESRRPWLVDRLLRHLLVDVTGNTHRAEFSIDKLYSPDGPQGRLGLVEFRAFEMPPHPRLSLVQMLLLRALVARFWRTPYRGELVRWGTRLHDRYLLPHFVAEDFADVLHDLQDAGYPLHRDWFAPFVEFRFPRLGTVAYQGIEIELRQAIEPWNVLGEEVAATATARYVDSSVERLQVKVTGMTDGRHQLACNGRPLPLQATGVAGEFVAGVRYRAWCPPSALHPTIPVQTPLVFDLVDRWSGRAIGGCTYHVAHPGGRHYESFPVTAKEAEARRQSRFWPHGHTPGPMTLADEPPNREFPCTLDLRRRPTAV